MVRGAGSGTECARVPRLSHIRGASVGGSYSYNAADQMVTDKDGVSYGYDLNGNQTGRGSDVFFYDHENRLTKINVGGVERDPCYDLTGDGAVTGADWSAVVARLGTGSGDPNYDPFYDLNGDRSISGADQSLVAGQLGLSCTTSRFTYNGDGLRTARVSSRYSDMTYVWDVAAGLPVMLKEQDLHNTLDGHGTDNTYVYGLDLISVTDRLGAQTYFLYDGLGSTANLTDGSGNTTATYGYDVFGAMRSESGTGAGANEWRFAGEQRDPQGNRNFYYLRARYYDAATGRFLSQDPLGIGDLYAYADNSPVNLIDPSGMASEGGAFVSCRPFIDPRFFGPDWVPSEMVPSPPLVFAGSDFSEFQDWPNPSCPGGGRGFGRGIRGGGVGAGRGAAKPVNLPAWRTVRIDMEHIESGHMAGGSRVSSNKGLFPATMNQAQVESGIRDAYRYGQRVRSQGDRVLVRGQTSDGLEIKMWVNTKTREIETAWPVQ